MSGSSFICITSLKNHEKVINDLTEYEKAVVGEMICSRDKFLGIEIVICEEHNGDWSTIGELLLPECFEEGDDYDNRSAAWNKYQKLVKEFPDEAFLYDIEG